MKRLVALLLVAAFLAAGCTHRGPGSGWTSLIDGEKGLENFNRIGDANWRAEGGAIVADKGKGGHLVSKQAYKDFEMYVEFWADHHTNSGIFLRASDANKVGAANAYEVNVFDQRPGPEYGTGGIVNFAQVPAKKYKAGGKWNVYEIWAKGNQVIVKLNGEVTVHMVNAKFASGPFSLQFGNLPKNTPGGAIKWRKVDIRPL